MERRDAERWQDEEQNTGRQTNASARKGYAVAGIQSGAIDLIDTARLANILVLGQKAPHLTETPLTGKPDARNSPVRFGGRGEVSILIPTPIRISHLWCSEVLCARPTMRTGVMHTANVEDEAERNRVLGWHRFSLMRFMTELFLHRE